MHNSFILTLDFQCWGTHVLCIMTPSRVNIEKAGSSFINSILCSTN